MDETTEDTDPKIDTGRMKALLEEQEKRLLDGFKHILLEYQAEQSKKWRNILSWIASQFK